MMKKANTAVVVHSEYWPHEHDLAFRKDNPTETGESVCKDCGTYDGGKNHNNKKTSIAELTLSTHSLAKIDVGGQRLRGKVDKRATRRSLPVIRARSDEQSSLHLLSQKCQHARHSFSRVRRVSEL